MGLLEEWAAWHEGDTPFVLEADRHVLFRDSRSAAAITTFKSWRAAHCADDFCKPGDKTLHLGLLPQPFCGDVRRALVYVLGLNPGLGPHDYFGEYQVPEFRQAVCDNLKLRFSKTQLPFRPLEPQFSWHGGFRWWHGRLAAVIEELASRRQQTFAAARAFLAEQIASVELVPYHSKSFHDGGGWIRNLHSVELARRFVTEFVVPRVINGEAILIVTRKARKWGPLPSHESIIEYTGTEARGAYLTPMSRGGKAMLERLLRA